MGPDGLNLLRESLQFTDKILPCFDEYGDYEQFEEIGLLWNSMTSIAAEKRELRSSGNQWDKLKEQLKPCR